MWWNWCCLSISWSALQQGAEHLEIKYNKTRPDTRYVTPAELDLVMRTARGGGISSMT